MEKVRPRCGQSSDRGGRLKTEQKPYSAHKDAEEINGDSTKYTMVWPTLGSRTAQEQNAHSAHRDAEERYRLR